MESDNRLGIATGEPLTATDEPLHVNPRAEPPDWRESILAIAKHFSLIWKKRHPHLRRRILRSVGALAVVFGGCWALAHWKDPDRDQKLTNFIAAFYPLAISVLAAFIPDLEKLERMRPIWRIGIIAGGLAYSIVLWHQQTISIESARSDRREAIADAVRSANEHSDKQIKDIRDDIRGVVQHSDGQIESVRKDVKNTTQEVAELLSKTSAALDSSIGKVGKPDPPVLAQLVFSLFDAYEGEILKTDAMRPDKDGLFNIEFVIFNSSKTTAVHLVDTWIDICDQCEFAKEPNGYFRPSGLGSQTRYRQFGILNPQTSTDKHVIAVKLKVPTKAQRFQVGWRYSCELCAKESEQLATITVLPVIH